MNRIAYFYDDIFLTHNSGNIVFYGSKGHLVCGDQFDTPQRIKYVHDILDISGMLPHLIRPAFYPVTDDMLLLVHDRNYISEFIRKCESAKKGLIQFGRDRSLGGANTESLARLAAGAACDAVSMVLTGSADHAYVLSRTAGRLAGTSYAKGYCFYNHAAIAAKYAQTAYNIPKVAVINWGSQHANGTQEIFYQDADVLTISVHEASGYPPKRGLVKEVGMAGAEGKNINIPLPSGSGMSAYSLAFEKIIFPVLTEFNPGLIILSAGQEAARYDPLGNMLLNRDAFYRLTKDLSNYAKEFCQGRLIALHEGGFSHEYTPICTLGVIEGLFGKKTSVQDELHVEDFPIRPIERMAIDSVMREHEPYWSIFKNAV